MQQLDNYVLCVLLWLPDIYVHDESGLVPPPYIVKYEAGGVEALRDNRGKQKSPDEMSELEKLRAEVKILKAEKARAEMEASFLKKLEEIERRRV